MTSKPRFPFGGLVKRLVIATVAILVFSVGALSEETPASGEGEQYVLLSNLGFSYSQNLSSSIVQNYLPTTTAKYAVHFTTGRHPDGYHLNSVDIALLRLVRMDIFVCPLHPTGPLNPLSWQYGSQITNADGDITHTNHVLSNNCSALIAPNPIAQGVNNFQVEGDLTLAANSTYALVFVRASHQTVNPRLSFNPAGQPGDSDSISPGWSNPNRISLSRYYVGGWFERDSTSLLRFQLNGRPVADLANLPPFFSDRNDPEGADPKWLGVDENVSDGHSLGPIAARDADNDTLTYTYSGTDAAAFHEDFVHAASGGRITVRAGRSPNFERKSSYSFTIHVSDGKDSAGGTSTAIDDEVDVTVDVRNMWEKGWLTFSSSEPDVGNPITVTLHDEDGSLDDISWHWWTGDRPNSYQTSVSDYSDTYTPTEADIDKYLFVNMYYRDLHFGSYRLQAWVANSVRASTGTTTLSLTSDTEGVITLSSAPPRVGETLSAVLHDADGFADVRWQWSRGTTPTGSFSAVSEAKESSYTPAPDDAGMYLQAAATYDDGHGPGKMAEAASSDPVRALVVNRPPAFPLPSVSFQLDHAAAPGVIVGTVGATDLDGDGLTYSLSGPDAAFFVIDAGTGLIRTASGVSFDAAVRSQYTVTVHADDGQGGADTADVVITVTARPIIVPPIGLGGGGGRGPSGPTPSDEDFEWTVTRDIDALVSANGSPTGLWSDGETLWIAENGDGANDAIISYDLASGERVEEREFALDETNRAPRGVWSDRTTSWVSDSGRERLFAYRLADGERLEEREFELPRENRDARGIWSDGETMWVLDGRADALFAYALASGELLAEYELDSANDDPRGIWSDGVTIWVSDHGAKRLIAYRLPVLPDAETDPGEENADDDARELERVSDEEFTELSKASNNSPRGIWSDGEVMYVADESDDRVYSYNMPDAIDARLASLTLSGVDFGEFDPGRTDYEGAVADGVTETTVEAEAMQRRTTIVTDPEDADTEVDGHQVALQDLGEIAVTVTSADDSRTRVYRVRFPETGWDPARDAWPHCLRGAISEGFSLSVFEGGSVEELVSCAESRGIAALYALHEGLYVSHILGAPDFVNAGFLELFPDGLPPITPLVAASNGPPSADPFGDLEDGGRQPWPECLRGPVASGFSLVVYEGGSVDELEACARSRDVTALYALSEGEFVSYILGAPDFVTQPFRDLFADGLPLMTPLVATSEGQPGGR